MATSNANKRLLCVLKRRVGCGAGCSHGGWFGAEGRGHAAPAIRSRNLGTGEKGSFGRVSQDFPIGQIPDALKLAWRLRAGRMDVGHLESSRPRSGCGIELGYGFSTGQLSIGCGSSAL